MTAIQKKRQPAKKAVKSDTEIARAYDKMKNADLYDTNGHIPVRISTTWIEVPTALVPEVRKFVQKHRKSA